MKENVKNDSTCVAFLKDLETSTAEFKERVPWVAVLAIIILIPIFGTYVVMIGKAGLKYWTSIGEIQPVVPFVVGPFLILFLSWIFGKVGYFQKRMNPRLLGYFYVAAISATWAIVGVDAGNEFNAFVGTQMVGNEITQAYIPSFMMPSKAAAELLWTGGPIPLGEWIPVLASYWVLYLMPSLMLLGMVALFRRRWIDVERVPFPTTMVAYEVLKRVHVSTSEKPTKGRTSFFLIGLIIGSIVQFLYLCIQLFPWFPDIFALRGGCGSGCALIWAVTPGTIWSGIIGLGTVNMWPGVVPFFYFIPLSVLFNSWFWYIVFLILAQVAYMMGYYTGFAGGPWDASRVLSEAPYRFMAVSEVGGMIGLTIFTIWLSRSYLIETLKAAFGQLPKETKENIERNEAMPYSLIWLLVILGFFGTTAFFMVMGLGIAAALIMPITFFVFLFADSRLYGLSGGYMRGWNHGEAFYRLLWPAAPDPMTKEFVVSTYFSQREFDLGSGRLWSPTYGAFDSYRMSDIVKLSNRNVFKILLLIALISPITVYSSEVLFGSIYGLSRTGICGSNYTCGAPWGTSASSWITLPSAEPWIPYMLAGIVIVGVLSILRARYIWFPFEPIGFLNATSFNSTISGLWLPFLIAWVLKTLTLRIGGSKAYENYGLPLAGGAVAGCMAITILGASLGIIRFYVPF